MGQYVAVHGEVISHVNISRALVEDGGLYTCVAENRAGRAEHSARLNIYGKRDQRAKSTYIYREQSSVWRPPNY
jgi:hypothetical protein